MVATVTRIAPGTVPDIESHQGWAMRGVPARGRRKAHDLVFVHGMAAGGWMWPLPWLGRFADAGHACWTVTLPGREGGATLASDPAAMDRVLSMLLRGDDATGALDALMRAMPGASALDGPDLDDFTDTLEQALDGLDRPAVVVAHSLGGAVAQNLLRRGRRPAGTVLLCSVPPYGTWRASAEMAIMAPDLWATLWDFSLFGVSGADPQVLRRHLFPSGVGEASYRSMLTNLRDESLPATLRAMGFPPFAPLPGPRGNILVLGGGRDRFIPPLDVALTAAYYGNRATILPKAGHMPMHEPGASEEIADVILGFLEDVADVRQAAT